MSVLGLGQGLVVALCVAACVCDFGDIQGGQHIIANALSKSDHFDMDVRYSSPFVNMEAQLEQLREQVEELREELVPFHRHRRSQIKPAGCVLHTYWQPLARGELPPPQIALWESAWHDAGWATEVISRTDAATHADYPVLAAAFRAMTGSNGMCASCVMLQLRL